MSFIVRKNAIFDEPPKLCEPGRFGGTQQHCGFFHRPDPLTEDDEDRYAHDDVKCDECAASMVAHPQLFAEFMRQARARGCRLSAVEMSERVQAAAGQHVARDRCATVAALRPAPLPDGGSSW